MYLSKKFKCMKTNICIYYNIMFLANEFVFFHTLKLKHLVCVPHSKPWKKVGNSYIQININVFLLILSHMFACIPCSLYLFSRIGPQYLTFKIGKNKTLKNKKKCDKNKKQQIWKTYIHYRWHDNLRVTLLSHIHVYNICWKVLSTL